MLTRYRIIARTLGLHSTSPDLATDPVALPTFIDDEYLSIIPNIYGKQPSLKPSLMAFFVNTTRLFDLLANVMDRFYTGSKMNDPLDSTSHASNEDPNPKGIVEAEAQLNSIWENLPSSLKFRQPVPGSSNGRGEMTLQAAVFRCR